MISFHPWITLFFSRLLSLTVKKNLILSFRLSFSLLFMPSENEKSWKRVRKSGFFFTVNAWRKVHFSSLLFVYLQDLYRKVSSRNKRRSWEKNLCFEKNSVYILQKFEETEDKTLRKERTKIWGNREQKFSLAPLVSNVSEVFVPARTILKSCQAFT